MYNFCIYDALNELYIFYMLIMFPFSGNIVFLFYIFSFHTFHVILLTMCHTSVRTILFSYNWDPMDVCNMKV